MTVDVLDVKPQVETIETGLEADARQELAGDLRRVLIDTIVLQVKTQVYHWNVVGPLFYGLHKLTDEHYHDLFVAADAIAERIRALGHIAPLDLAELSEEANLSEESSKQTAAEMVDNLIADHERLIRNARKAARRAEESGDFVTHDLLTGRLAFHEQAVWMLRAIAA
jgi:starvation-inducible DNA-binding protein